MIRYTTLGPVIIPPEKSMTTYTQLGPVVGATLTPTVGVAPGTTTMQLGKAPGSSELVCLGGPCPPDPVRYYTSTPNVKMGWASGATGPTIYDPYGTESQLRAGLRGLSGLGEARLGVGVVAAVLGFAAMLGYGFWKRGR